MSDKKILVIVESPTKQKTIGKILGKQYNVKSSFGHVRDLPAKELGVDEEGDFSPKYIEIPKAKKNIADLKEQAKKADKVYLATDPDREGESIAWHLSELLKLPKERVGRISFHEITPTAVKNAIDNVRNIDACLVEAQQARRVLDRLVGYKLSPLLWKKIHKGLSAGRVQSVAIRLLVERAKEIDEFKKENYQSLIATLSKPSEKPNFSAKPVLWKGQKVESTTVYKLFADDYRVKSTCFKTPEDIAPLKEALDKGPLKVVNIEESKNNKQYPRPPFITSSLQQEAYTKLGFSSQRTMSVAQSLYEGIMLEGELVGLITYMRTDSFNVSRQSQDEAQKFVESQFGKSFFPAKPTSYKRKVKGAQEAHEAIHPTSVYRTPENMKKYLSSDQAKLYELIWRKFLASQMSPALFDSVNVDISIGNDETSMLKASGRTMTFEGYLKVYKDRNEDDEKDDDSILPPLKQGDDLSVIDCEVKSHETSPPPLYNEASLIKTLEKHGIGRPSTYAPIIHTIVARKYVLRQLKTKKLIPTELGITVTNKLKDFFPEIMDLPYTAQIEDELDEIADGNIKWNDVVKKFYCPFTEDLAKAYDNMQAETPKPSDEKCPLCASPMLIRQSRFGKYLSCSKFPACKGKMQLDEKGEVVVPKETDEACNLCGKKMVIRYGRRGKFLACSGYPKCKNTYSINAQGEKIKKTTPIMTDRKCEKCSKPLVLRNGPKGHFLACSGYPKCKNIVSATEDEIQEILDKEKQKEDNSQS
jgi:DNA topoisomerase I